MCNRVVLIYSYRMNLIFLLVAFSFRKKARKEPPKEIWLPSKRVLIFFKKIFLSMVLKYVQLD